MVAPAPNLTVVTGTILARRPDERRPDWDVVSLAVDGTSPVPGLRDLAGPAIARAAQRGDRPDAAATGEPGDAVTVGVRRALLGAAGPGWRIGLRVRLTPAGLLAEPHPAGPDLTLTPPP